MDECRDRPSRIRRALRILPLGSIRPTGWLRNQLQIQAGGLSGHLDEFWPDIAESGWIGGCAEGWERGPYWLDGIIPLAILLDDRKLKEKADRWADYILTHPHEDGWLGPIQDTATRRYRPYDPWPVYVALKALTQYEEATRDPRVVPAMARFFRRLDRLLDEQPLFDWGKSRWADLVLSLHWLHDRLPEPWVTALARKVRDQGYDWRGHFEIFKHRDKVPRESCDQTTHVVNNAMGIKAPGVWFAQSGDPTDRDSVFRILETLDTYHGQATGIFTGDEHYAGKNPSQGTELCAVVEFMFSLEILLAILGEPALGDRLERVVFNALPATFKPDMWAHQYDQQANQVVCRVSEDRIYTNNGPQANIFGLEPNYGCRTANMHQGWPKFAAHLWMKTPDGGLVAVAYAPSAVTTDLDGIPFGIELETDYPFDENLRFTVRSRTTGTTPIHLRIPAWAKGAEIRLREGGSIRPEPGTFCRLERAWADGEAFTLRLPMTPVIERRYRNAVSLHRGPLVYSLRIDEEWRQIGGEPPHADWEVYPASPWNYALSLNPRCPEAGIRFEPRPVGSCPFSPEGAPILAKVRGHRLPDWGLEHNAAAPPPPSPIRVESPPEDLVLIPYGCTNLRVTEFPWYEAPAQPETEYVVATCETPQR